MEAKRHYSQAHAKNAILCNWCEKPIQSPYFSCYRKHFERIHPNEKIPFDEDASSEESIEIRAQSTTGHVTQVRKIVVFKLSVISLNFFCGFRETVMSAIRSQHTKMKMMKVPVMTRTTQTKI